MEINENLTEVLNDLIQINNDRIDGYKRAVKESEDNDVDLKAIFNKMADESRQYTAELTREVVKLGGEPATGTTASGKIYRAWMDVKATFSGSDRHAILASCEYGEDAAQKAYTDALESDDTLSIDIRQLIANQKASLKISHDTIKKYRDMSNDDDNVRNNDNYTNKDKNYNLSDTAQGSGNYGTSENISKNSNLNDINNLTDFDKTNSSTNSSGSGNLRNNL